MQILGKLIVLACAFLWSTSAVLAHSMKEAQEALEKGDYKRHVQLLEELGRQGNGDALDALGKLYATGRIVDLDMKKAHELFEKGYAAGSLYALCHIGMCYEYGEDVKKNPAKAKELWVTAYRKGFDRAPLFLADYYSDKRVYSEAVKLLKESIEHGCADASYELSCMYTDGLGVTKDEKKALALCTNAAKAGSTKAICQLAYNYELGKGGLHTDYKLAKEWAEKGIAKGDGECQAILARLYLDRNYPEANVEKGLALCRKAAEQRIPYALWRLGAHYESGTHVKKDWTKARDCFQLAADRDYGPAQSELGNMLLEGGNGIKPDPKAAYILHLKAAQKGDNYSQYNVGNALRTGIGVKRDSKAACRWYEDAIKNGNPHACNQLAMMYFSGTTDGVAKNEKEGVRLLVKGANMGCPVAQSNLAGDYELGKYFKKDMKQALYWYKKSADQNADNRVPYHIGELYEKGLGVPQDRSVAISYYKRAAKLGNKIAKHRLQELQLNR